MTKKELIIQQINDFEKKYFNQDQKKIMIDIIENAPEEKAQVYFDFLKYKRKNGFTFDYSPEIAMGRIIKLYEDKKRRINVDDEVTNNENKLIIGDNYNALKSLLVTHKNRINIIYIDPPYNTESAKDDGNQSSKEGIASKFIYKDKFGRGGWLNMMKQRLDLAKELLTDDGVIFVSIDDQEQAYLKVLMDEIFGEENFIINIPRATNFGGKNFEKFLKNNHDYVLIYAKNIQLTKEFSKEIHNGKNYIYSDEKFGKYSLKEIDAPAGLGYISSLDFDVEFNGKKFKPINAKGERNRWKWSKERFQSAKKIEIIVEKNNRLYYKMFLNYKFDGKKLIKESRKIAYSSLRYSNNNYLNTKGTNDLKNIFSSSEIFSYPKPINLVKDLIELNNKNNAIILDFFAGSGTTGQAVMELNREDGGHRQFILCTNNENQIAENITYERLHRVIVGRSTKGEKDFKWLEKNQPYKNEKLRVIWIDDTIKINNDLKNGEEIENDILKGLKLLDPSYSQDNLNFYYDLAALNPLESE